MKIRASNTGRTIGVLIDGVTLGDRYKVNFDTDNKAIVVIRDDAGRSAAKPAGWITYDSDKIPGWPTHGVVEIEHTSVSADGYSFRLPDALPAAKKRAQRQPKSAVAAPDEKPWLTTDEAAAAVEQLTKPQPNVLICANGKDYPFLVPQQELLDLALEWAAKGYRA